MDAAGTAGRVREMEPHERKTVARVMQRSFNWFTRLFFDFGTRAYVYELDGEIVGGTTLTTFSAGRRRGSGGTGRTVGVVKWLFTVPEARGHGAAGQLVDAAIAWFREQGCTDMCACVEGHNTGSSNIFARRGFLVLPFREQVRRYGVMIPRVWFGAFHLFDVGHFLWVRREANGAAPAEAPRDVQQAAVPADGQAALPFVVTVLVQAAALYPAMIRWTGIPVDAVSPAVDPLTPAWQALAVVLTVFTVRLGAMKLAARAFGQPVQYRPWETGLLLSFVLGLVGAGPFPVPGSLYPRPARKDGTWSYRQELPWMGPMAYAGGISMLVLGWGLHVLSVSSYAMPHLVSGAVDVGVVYVRILLLFEVLIPVFPFGCYNGRRVMDWRRPSWAVLAAGSILLWVASTFLT